MATICQIMTINFEVKWYGRTELFHKLTEAGLINMHLATFRRFYRQSVFDREELERMDVRNGFTPGEVRKIIEALD